MDAVALPQGLLAELAKLDLHQERWVCIASADSPTATAASAQDLADHR
ncbi:hypothetical protein [Streptomyces sp. BK79]